MKTLTADEILEKTFQHLKVMLEERNQEIHCRNEKRQNITDKHMFPKYQMKKEKFAVKQEEK